MDLFGMNLDKGLLLAAKLDAKYAPALDRYSPAQQAATALYFLPHKSQKEILSVTRPRIIKWYCPFANQKDFPSGHRYCINVYTGCKHKCIYCYAQGYEPQQTSCKNNYKKKLAKDLSELAEYNVPPAPLHLSNSTDPCQPIELTQKLTFHTLKEILKYRKYFTSIVILTKNSSILANDEYMEILKKLATLPDNHQCKETFEKQNVPALRIETSLAFSNQSDADFFDPAAPAIKERMQAIKTLRKNGLAVILRIDPLLPRDPLTNGKSLKDFNLPDSQSLDKLEILVKFASENSLHHIVYSVAKITQPRYRAMTIEMQNLKSAYEHIAAGQRLVFRGGSWRLPDQIAKEKIVKPFLKICQKYKIPTCFCKQNLLKTP